MKVYGYEDRSEILGQYLIEHGSTVRATASHFGISKSTVHKDVSERLCEINPTLYSQVKIIQKGIFAEEGLQKKNIRT